jgi:exosortase E/protease (VPEID-CTERM system)
MKMGKFLSLSHSVLPRHFLGRLYLLVAVLVSDILLVEGALDSASPFYSRLIAVGVVASAMFLGLGHPWLKRQQEDIRFGFSLFSGYLAFVFAAILIQILKGLQGSKAENPQTWVFIIIALFLLRIPLLALACIPFRDWIRLLQATKSLWIYAALTGVVARLLAHPFQKLWLESNGNAGRILQNATFHSVQSILKFILPGASFNAANFTVETSHYGTEIGASCSGMEGLGLILVFTAAWLWYSRKEIRILRAILLIPGSLACIWLLNLVRLCGLILIGNSWSEEIANVGFHSQFGWIAFTVVALSFSMVTQKLSWLQKVPFSVSTTSDTPPVTQSEKIKGTLRIQSELRGESLEIRAYLIPFLAILAATSVSKASSGYFEWLYPLRFVAAAFAIYYFWPELKKLNWRFGWIAPLAGVAVFLMWIAPSWLAAHQPATSILGTALASLSPTTRWTWIAFRVAAAVVTVPIAEELAFRGFLARRLICWDFSSLPFTGLTVFSIVLSSAVFGLEHMKNMMDWPHLLAGFLAGCAYAFTLRWRGRMGDAVAAHAVSNLLLAAWVLGSGDWAQW